MPYVTLSSKKHWTVLKY